MTTKFYTKNPVAAQLLKILPILMFFMGSNLYGQTQNSTLYDSPGVIYASTITWSKQDNKLYLKGDNIKVKHGNNDFKVNGKASYLGEVHYLTFNQQEVSPDTPLDIAGSKCQVVKLNREEALRKYGDKGKLGAVEITEIR